MTHRSGPEEPETPSGLPREADEDVPLGVPPEDEDTERELPGFPEEDVDTAG
jgi:hypothetical protein